MIEPSSHSMKTSRMQITKLLVILGVSVFAQSQIRAATLVNLRFNEGDGLTTVNAGTSGGVGAFSQQNGFPIFATSIPTGPFTPRGNTSSIDFGPVVAGDGGRAIDFPPETAAPTFGLTRFTATGWLNLRSDQIGPGGNRIITTWPGEFGSTRGGFEVVQESSGRLRLGVNEAPDFPGPGPFSSFDRLTIDPNTSDTNWVFFAITYDAGDLVDTGDGTVNFYFGNGSTLATLDTTASYDRGAILNVAPGKSETLTVGNFTIDVTARFETGGGARIIRGLVDELAVFDTVLSETEIRAVQTIPEPGSALLAMLTAAGIVVVTRTRRVVRKRDL